MKTNKAKFAVPVIAFMMAVGAAFATTSSTQSNSAFDTVPGYVHNGLDCIESIQCSSQFGTICTVGGAQVFGMNPAGTKCNRELYKL